MEKPKRITKKWRMEMARLIIDRNFIDQPFPASDVFDFAEICQQPITGAIRKINPQYPSDPRHLHTEIDGQWAARSWREFIMPSSPKVRAKKAMRHVVVEDMRDFLSSVTPAECAMCGTDNDLTVDHVAPPFDDIANAFIEERGIPSIVDSSNPNIVVNMFESMDEEAYWIAFHAARASYQVLCRSCNSSKGKR